MIAFIRQHWKLVLIVIVLGIGAGLGFKPALGGVREWRAQRLLAEAQDFAGKGEWEEVRRTAAVSTQLHPSFEAFRLYFQAQRALVDPDLLRTAAVLCLHPEATAGDRAAALTVFLDATDLPGFGQLLATVPEEQRKECEIRYQEVRFLLMSGKLQEAVRLADAESESSAERKGAFELLLSGHLIRDPRPEVRAEAFGRIDRLLDQPDRESALSALRILASQPDERIDGALAGKALRRFEHDPGLGLPEQLAIVLFRVGLDPEHRDTLIAGAVTEYGEKNPALLLDWLLRLGESEEVVSLTDGKEGDADSFQCRMIALRRLKRYETMAEELKDPPSGVPSVDANATAAAVAELRGRTAEAADLWQQAFSSAEMRGGENPYFRIAGIAREAGAHDAEMEALARGIEHRLGILPPAREFLPLFAWLKTRDNARLLSISRRLLQREPGNPTLINNYHYLVTLHRGPEKDTVAALRSVVDAYPELLPLRGSLALAQLKSNDPRGALSTLDASETEPVEFPAGEKAIYAATLAALGRSAESRALQQGIDWQALDQGESKLYKDLIIRSDLAASESEAEPQGE